MALPSSGAIRLGADVNVELGSSSTTQISLGQSTVRTLYGVASADIRLAADGYGKANRSTINLIINSNTRNYNIFNNKGSSYVAGKSDVIVTINSGVIVGSTFIGNPAMTTQGGSYVATVTAARGQSGTARLSYSSSTNPFNVGQTIVVSDITPTSFNGTYTVTSNSYDSGTGLGTVFYSNTTFFPGPTAVTGQITGVGWASGDTIKIINNGYIVGKGGNGVTYTGRGTGNETGGTALQLQYATTITNNGVIGGGGGGGGAGALDSNFANYNGGSGGGGAGDSPGIDPNGYSSTGTLTSGGNGAIGFNGGNAQGGGQAGTGGSAGVAGGVGGNAVAFYTGGGGGGGGGLGAAGGLGGSGGNGIAGAAGAATSGAATYATWLVTGTRYGTIG